MQPGKQAQIKQMVETTKLFSEPERQEWLVLFELMNDKQMLELEKILSFKKPQAVQPPVVSTEPHLSQQVATQPEKKAPAQVRGADMLAQFKTASKPSTQPVEKRELDNPFKTKLANMLQEKELTPGHPEPELELSEHAGVPSPVPKTTQVVFNGPVKFEIKEEKKNKPIASLAAHPAAKKPPVVPTAPKPPLKAKEAVQPKAPSVAALAKAISKKAEENKEKPIAKPKEAMNPGLFNSNLLLDAKLAAFRKGSAPSKAPTPEKNLQKPSPSPSTSPAANITVSQPVEAERPEESTGGTPVKFNGLEDLNKLNVSEWKKLDYRQMVEQVRKLISNFGYHEVIFKLEHSPVYGTYIDTGLKILQDQVSFETVSQDKAALGKRYMSKAEFERFADMLRQIQAG